MPNFCASYGCSNNSSKEDCKERGVSFHHFPFSEPIRLRIWLENMKRKDYTPSKRSVLCSDHFTTESFDLSKGKKFLNSDAVPTIFIFTEKSSKRKRTSYEFGASFPLTEIVEEAEVIEHSEPVNCSSQTDQDVISVLLDEINALQNENYRLKEQIEAMSLQPDNLSDKEINCLTGFNKSQFNAIFSFLEIAENVKHVFSAKMKFFIFLFRLKTSTTEETIALLFKTNQSTISRIFSEMIDVIYAKVSNVNIWPNKQKVIDFMPHLFHLHFPDCRVIIDTTEFFIQKPTDPKIQQITWSNYKNHNTVKCLIGISPSGGISFISDTWGGSISDKEIFLKSGLLNLLEPGDVILADRGFTITKEIEKIGCKIYTPNFLKDKIQFNIVERKENKKISRHRVHVERAINRIKKFKFFDNITITSLHSIGQLIYIIGFLSNFGNPLIQC